MPTPDRQPGPEKVEKLQFEDEGQTAAAQGELTYLFGPGRFSQRDAAGEYDPRPDGATHRAADQLVHAIAESSFEEYTYTGNRVDAIIVWETAAKLKKIRETLFTYAGNKVATITTKQYDAAGALITGETMTETLSYTGSQLDDITRVLA